MSVLNPQYTAGNLVAYNLAGFACIAFAVFLLSTQPFYLTDIIGVDSEKVGKAIGTLAIVDELTVIAVAPVLGTLVDWLNGYAWQHARMPSGSRSTELAGFVVLGIALLGYGQFARHTFPELYFFRAVFAVGMSGVMSVAVVMLHEANNSDFRWEQFCFWRKSSGYHSLSTEAELDPVLSSEDGFVGPRDPAEESNKNGKLSALLGTCTGLGAVFSVAFFLTLPVSINKAIPEWTSKETLQASYTILAALAILSGVAVFFLGYDCVKRRRDSGLSVGADFLGASYWKLMGEAISVSRSSPKLQLAYIGGFVARAATVTSTMFIPLMVYQFYMKQGWCGDEDKPTAQGNCYKAYLLLSEYLGIASAVSLVLTPLWGFLIDREGLGCLFALACSGALGAFGSFWLCVLGSSEHSYTHRKVWYILSISCMSTAQVGVMIASMSLVSRAGRALEQEHRVIGSVTGLYSLSGGVGILLVATIGGSWSDSWVFGLFLLLGVFYVVLLIAAGIARYTERGL